MCIIWVISKEFSFSVTSSRSVIKNGSTTIPSCLLMWNSVNICLSYTLSTSNRVFARLLYFCTATAVFCEAVNHTSNHITIQIRRYLIKKKNQATMKGHKLMLAGKTGQVGFRLTKRLKRRSLPGCRNRKLFGPICLGLQARNRKINPIKIWVRLRNSDL